MFKELFTDLNLLQQIFFVIAASSTLILIVQTILALIGIGQGENADVGGDTDVDAGIDIADTDIDIDIDLDTDINVDVDTDIDTGAVVSGAANCAHTQNSFDIHGLRLFTVRSIMAFFMMGSWCGLILTKIGMSETLACLGAFIAGSASLVFMAKLMQMLMGLQEDGTMNVRNALGQVGQVYIRIPAGERGMGKVNITVQTQLREFDAVTETGETISTGEMVYVTDIRAGNILVVEKMHNA